MQKCSSCKRGAEQGAKFSWKVEPSGASEGRLFSTCDRCRGRKSTAAKKGLSGTEPDLESLSSGVTELRGKLQNLEERRALEVTELRGRVQNLEERRALEVTELRGKVQNLDDRRTFEVTELRGNLRNLDDRRALEVTELRGNLQNLDDELRGRVQNLEQRLTMMEQGGADTALSDMFWDETGADMAEWFALKDPGEPVEAGDIVELIDGQISRKPNLE